MYALSYLTEESLFLFICLFLKASWKFKQIKDQYPDCVKRERQSVSSAACRVFLYCFSSVIGDAERIGEAGEYLTLGSCLLIPQEVLQYLKAHLPPKAKGNLKDYPEQKVMWFVALLFGSPLSLLYGPSQRTNGNSTSMGLWKASLSLFRSCVETETKFALGFCSE